MTKLLIATTNHKKKEELKALLKGLNIEVITLDDVKGAPKVKEDGKTFKENAVKKATQLANYTGLLTLADDSGLEMKVLDGAPGVYSARFSGRGANDFKNIKKLLKLLEGVPKEKRRARFVCTIAIAEKNKLLKIFTGTVSGRIADKPLGNYGFGYDPVFIPNGFNKTFAQLSPRIKNIISHRANALQKAKNFLAKNFQKFSPGP